MGEKLKIPFIEMSQNKITAVLGPTNTGKTFLAIETMLSFDSGMIGFAHTMRATSPLMNFCMPRNSMMFDVLNMTQIEK